jgi:hypothetical protein
MEKDQDRRIDFFRNLLVFIEDLRTVYSEKGNTPFNAYCRSATSLDVSRLEDEDSLCKFWRGFLIFNKKWGEEVTEREIDEDCTIRYGTDRNVHIPIGTILSSVDDETKDSVYAHLDVLVAFFRKDLQVVSEEIGGDFMEGMGDVLKSMKMEDLAEMVTITDDGKPEMDTEKMFKSVLGNKKLHTFIEGTIKKLATTFDIGDDETADFSKFVEGFMNDADPLQKKE